MIPLKKIVIVFIALLLVFISAWAVKAKVPAMRPNSYVNGLNSEDGVWWNQSLSAKADEQWVLDPEIPDNYLPVPGEDEMYMVVDENGNIIQYRHRVKQDDGSWVWEDVTTDIPDNYEPVAGLKDVYQVVDENGNASYYKYVRNSDNSYAFVPVDKNGNVIEEAPPTDGTIPSNYAHVSGNVYAVLNEHGVIIGYKERVLNNDGSYSWKDTVKPQTSGNSGNTSYNSNQPQPSQPPASNNNGGGGFVTFPGNDKNTVQNSDGTYTETETLITTENSGGWIITYQTKVTRVYDSKGKLLSTKKEGPVAINKTQSTGNNEQAPDSGKIASTLKSETARMSAGANYNTTLANEVLASLNAERAAQGLPALKMDTNSNAYMLAKCRAAAMATYNYSDYDSPLYGTLSQMCSRFNISSNKPSENTWKTVASKSASEIHSRFMVLDGAREARMSSQYTNVGIAIVQKNGYYYICEVFVD